MLGPRRKKVSKNTKLLLSQFRVRAHKARRRVLDFLDPHLQLPTYIYLVTNANTLKWSTSPCFEALGVHSVIVIRLDLRLLSVQQPATMYIKQITIQGFKR